MADTRQATTVTKASWDEINIGILLQLLVDEIDAGNRPRGQFTRQAWANIAVKFQDLSGCNFTQPQLKNKWDNLKKDFSIWEKLRMEETGLGYDYNTGRIIADAAWWRQKIQERPEYKKFRTHGPVHLDLQERVFRGQVATGYMEYIPTRAGEYVSPEQSTEQPTVDPVTDEAQPDNITADRQHVRSNNRSGNMAKRKRSRRSSKGPSQCDVNSNMMELIDKWHEHAESNYRVRPVANNGDLSYTDSLSVLSDLPWLDEASEDYMDALVLLEDPLKREALFYIKDKPEELVRGWIRKLQHEKNRRLF